MSLRIGRTPRPQAVVRPVWSYTKAHVGNGRTGDAKAGVGLGRDRMTDSDERRLSGGENPSKGVAKPMWGYLPGSAFRKPPKT